MGGATNIAPADDKLIRAEYPLSIDPRCQLLASIMAKKALWVQIALLSIFLWEAGQKYIPWKKEKTCQGFDRPW